MANVLSYIGSHWQQIIIMLIGVMTAIQEVLALMGHGSGAITSIISFLTQVQAELGAPPSMPPPAAPPKA